MSDHAPSRIALVVATPVEDVAALVAAARGAGDIDRAAARSGDGRVAMDVHWGGRMQRALVRSLTGDDGAALLLTEASIGDDRPDQGLARQAQLLQGLARVIGPAVVGVRDLSSQREHAPSWLPRIAVGAAEPEDAIAVTVEGDEVDDRSVHWVLTHGAARFGVPDLELYGVRSEQVADAVATLRQVHRQLLDGGLGAALSLTDGTPVRLVPALEAWAHLPMEWPGTGRAGRDRGPGLDGPRATLSVLHRPRLGRYRLDLDGVLERLADRR
jgi:hypothetical protein